MLNWDIRYQEADEQNRKYIQKSIHEKEMNQEEVTKLIEKWIKDSKLDDIVSKPVTIDFEELNSLVIKREIGTGDKVVRVNVQRKVNEIESQIWSEAFDKKGEIRDNTKHYIWVTFRADRMVVTVGKTNMKTGDLLKYPRKKGVKTGDTKILIQQLLTPIERVEFDDLNWKIYPSLNPTERVNFDELSKKMYQYTQSALVMGVDLTLDNKKEGGMYQFRKKANSSIPIKVESEKNRNLDSFVKKLETQLGEYLLDKKIAILNKYSHNY